MAAIYKIRNLLNNKLYIGSTQKENSFKRKGEHFCELRGNYHYNIHLQNAFNLYGEENFIYEIIEEFKFPIEYDKEYIYQYINCREIYYITLLNAEYNIAKETRGGKLGRKLSEEEKIKIGNRSRGRNHSIESIVKIKNARAQQVITEDHKRKVSEKMKGNKFCLGNKQSKEQRELASDNLGKHYINKTGIFDVEIQKNRISKMTENYRTPEMRDKFKSIFRERNRKPFLCFRNGELVNEFSNQIEAAEVLGFDKPWGISSVLTGVQKTHKGYTFKYKE